MAVLMIFAKGLLCSKRCLQLWRSSFNGTGQWWQQIELLNHQSSLSSSSSAFFAPIKWILHHFPFHPWSKGHQDQFLLKRNIHNPRTSLTRFQYIDKTEHFIMIYISWIVYVLVWILHKLTAAWESLRKFHAGYFQMLLHFSRHSRNNDYHAST